MLLDTAKKQKPPTGISLQMSLTTKNKSQSSKTRAALALKSAGLMAFLLLEIDEKFWLAAQVGVLAAQMTTQ